MIVCSFQTQGWCACRRTDNLGFFNMNAWILARKLALMSGGKNRSSIPCTHAAILPPHPSIQARRPEVRVCTFCCAAVVVDCTLSCTPLVAPVTWSAMLAFGPSGVGLRGWEVSRMLSARLGCWPGRFSNLQGVWEAIGTRRRRVLQTSTIH